MNLPYAYSFQDVVFTISGPGGSFSIAKSGVAKEGISIEPNERVSTQYGTGSWMHTLHASKGGKGRIRFLKNGAGNAILSKMFDFDTASSANVGQNIITLANPVAGDDWTALGCAFTRKPTVVYSDEGPMNEWEFNVGQLDGVFGAGPNANAS